MEDIEHGCCAGSMQLGAGHCIVPGILVVPATALGGNVTFD